MGSFNDDLQKEGFSFRKWFESTKYPGEMVRHVRDMSFNLHMKDKEIADIINQSKGTSYSIDDISNMKRIRKDLPSQVVVPNTEKQSQEEVPDIRTPVELTKVQGTGGGNRTFGQRIGLGKTSS